MRRRLRAVCCVAPVDEGLRAAGVCVALECGLIRFCCRYFVMLPLLASALWLLLSLRAGSASHRAAADHNSLESNSHPYRCCGCAGQDVLVNSCS
jgi:hypothetical protein